MALADTKVSLKKLGLEGSSIEPSTMINFFEIDVSDIGFNNSVVQLDSVKVFRFHNSIKLTQKDIWFQGLKYVAIPIVAEGFEKSAKGRLPTPKLSITVNDKGIQSLTNFKSQIKFLGDIIGAKVTRIRTFAKYIDEKNFEGQEQPAGFDPDPNAKYPNDVFFINRKSLETKNRIEYELASPMDVEGIQLPLRQVVARTCRFCYRGSGCNYEYNGDSPFFMRKNSTEHENASLLPEAPAVATKNNELIFGDIITDSTKLVDKGEFVLTKPYNKGNQIYIEKDNIKYYFVAKRAVPRGKAPPNDFYWVADECSKNIAGCKIRFDSKTQGHLPFGGFPGVEKLGG